MIVRCSKRDLVKALSIAKRAISTKTLLPVLSGIKLSAADDKLSLTTSDTDLSIITHIDAKINMKMTRPGMCRA